MEFTVAHVPFPFASAQAIEEARVVRIVLEQKGLLCSPLVHHPTANVVDRARKCDSQMSCHVRTMAWSMIACKVHCQGLTPMPPALSPRGEVVADNAEANQKDALTTWLTLTP